MSELDDAYDELDALLLRRWREGRTYELDTAISGAWERLDNLIEMNISLVMARLDKGQRISVSELRRLNELALRRLKEQG